MKEQPVILRYVRFVKKLFVALSCVVIPALMVCGVFAFIGYVGFWIVTPVLLVAYLAVYGWYALRVSMGTAVGTEITKEVVHIKTKRGIYTYDVRTGCVAIRETSRGWVATFRTQTSQESYIFYRRPPLSKPYETAFTAADIDAFWHGGAEAEIL